MSQRTSPKSPRSKSPSCQEDETGNVSRARFDDLPDERLEDSGTRSYSRPGSVQDPRSRNASPLRPSSRLGSGYNNEEDLFQLPSPPQTLSAPSSRGASQGVSQRLSTRLPTSEYSRAGSSFLGSREDSRPRVTGIECESPKDLEGPMFLSRATSYSPRDRSSREPSEVMGGSNMNSVHFVSSREGAESRGTQGQATCPASSEMLGLASNKGSGLGSFAGLASGTGMPSVRGSASGAGCSSAGSMLGLSCARQSPDVTSGNLAPGASALSRKQLSSKEGSRLDPTCRADCKRYLNEIEKAGPSKASLRNPVSRLSENLKQRNSQPLYSQEVRQAGPESYVPSGGRGNTSGRIQADLKGLQMPTTSHVHHHHHHHHHDRRLQDELERDDRAITALAHLSQLKKTPSYLMCGVNQNVDFFDVCSEKKKTKKLPERPCLQQEELVELIKCERQDVDSAWYLASEERKTYKKPCPKQQKAQMNVKAIVKAHANQSCGEKYPPLELPDPEDISPEVAASMMFSQEQGIRMDDCPKNTILHLFPDEFKQPFPEKILRNSISIVDPNEKDQEELIEKSAAVPSEGVSDSAYTRTMKEKGEDLPAQKSFDVDFAIGQSKREYVLVAQKPRRFSKVQFRGGNLPFWFPGYFSAFPNENGIKSVSSPSGVFHKAWFYANPRNMPTNDVIVLD